MSKKVPVLFIIFKRKQESLIAFDTIKAYQPDALYIVADGPRPHVDNEKIDCEETRQSILDSIDWECKVSLLFREDNKGCTLSVYEGLNWFFEHEEYGVIIEDDILLSIDFLMMAECLLPHYRDNEKVMMISAQNRRSRKSQSKKLVFGTYTYIWGWATWRRAWQKMDMNMKEWSACKKRNLLYCYGMFTGFFKWRSYRAAYKSITSGSWDTRWAFSVFINKGLVLMPLVNLAKNIGIGCSDSANYRKGDEDPHSQLEIGSIEWPLCYPSNLAIDKRQHIQNQIDYLRERLFGLRNKLKRLWH